MEEMEELGAPRKKSSHAPATQIKPKEIWSRDALESMEKKLLDAAATAKAVLLERAQALEERFARAEQLIDSTMRETQSLTTHVQTILDGADIKSWRAHTEATYREGREQVFALQESYSILQTHLRELVTRCNQVSTQSVKNISKSLGSLHPREFHQLVDSSNDEVKTIADRAAQQITDAIHSFRWKNMALVILLSLLASLCVDLFAHV
jgi:hypothetical protein